MAIEVKERKEPSKISEQITALLSEAEKAGFLPLGWLHVLVFIPITVAGFANPEGTTVLTIMGSVTARGLALRGVDLVSQLDSGICVTTTSVGSSVSQSLRGIFKYSHPDAKIPDLVAHHATHVREHKGKLIAGISTLQDLERFIRERLDYEMKESIHRHWLIPARTVATESKPTESLEGCYISVDSLSIRVIMDGGAYIWGAFGIHDSGTYKEINKDEYSCKIEFKSKIPGADRKQVRLTREGKQYLFTPMPRGDSPDIFRRLDGAEFLADSKGRMIKKPTLGEGVANLPVETTVEEFETGFVQNIRKDVIPFLIKAGKLTGKTVKKKLHVLDDDVFRRTMRLGIERFVYNRQGWTFVAFQAPIGSVAEALRARRDVSNYAENVGVSKLSDDALTPASEGRRHVFLLHYPGNKWSILVQTVHWIEEQDPTLAVKLAGEISKTLKTKSIAAWDDNFSGSVAVTFESGKKKEELSDEEDHVEFYARFYAEGIYLSEAFITEDRKKAQLMMSDGSAPERVDYLQVTLA